MDFSIGAYAIALLAGALSTLSPCVLPLLPIIIGSSVAEHKAGPLVLAAGMALNREGKYLAFFPPGTLPERMETMVREALITK